MAVDKTETTAGAVISAVAATAPLAFLVVGLRMWTVFGLTHRGSLQDLLILCALGCSVIMGIMMIEETGHGMGHHTETLSDEDYDSARKFRYEAIIPYFMTLALVKTSVLMQYLHSFRSKMLRKLCICTLGFEIVSAVVTVLVSFLLCHPISYFWNPNSPDGHCLNRNVFLEATTAVGIMTEIVIVVMPLPWLRTLKRSRREYQVLGVIVALGVFVCILGMLRLHAFAVISQSDDPSWENPFAASWSFVEANVAIVTTSLLSLRPLVARFAPRVLNVTAADERERDELPPHSKDVDGDFIESGKAGKSTMADDIEASVPETSSEGPQMSEAKKANRRSAGALERLEKWESTVPKAQDGWITVDEDEYFKFKAEPRRSELDRRMPNVEC